jgi:putative flippase GtrA
MSSSAHTRPLFGWQFLKFLGLGAVAAVANYSSRFAFDLVMAFEASVVLAYVVGMIVAFILFRKYVFGDAGDGMLRQVSRFAAVNSVGATIAVAVSSLFARLILPAIGWEAYPFSVAHMLGVMSPTLASYLGHKFFTYKPKTGDEISRGR